MKRLQMQQPRRARAASGAVARSSKDALDSTRPGWSKASHRLSSARNVTGWNLRAI